MYVSWVGLLRSGRGSRSDGVREGYLREFYCNPKQKIQQCCFWEKQISNQFKSMLESCNVFERDQVDVAMIVELVDGRHVRWCKVMRVKARCMVCQSNQCCCHARRPALLANQVARPAHLINFIFHHGKLLSFLKLSSGSSSIHHYIQS